MTDTLRERLQSSLGGAYTLDRELGGGGMARVFVARDEALGREVVVKVLAPELAGEVSAERFAREIRLAARLQEPHIVPVLAAGAAGDGTLYYTMPFVRGASLRQRLREGPVPADAAVAILRDVAKALAYAHAQGVVHRDIKPENVLLSSGTAVVADFGIAKALAAAATSDGAGRPAHAGGRPAELTALGASLGTPAYMAPEQALGDPDVDHRADIYSWGVVAYELLAGRHPFAHRGSSPQQLVAGHLADAPAPLSSGAAAPALADLVMRCLEKSPTARPASAHELVDVLDAVRTGEGAATRRAPRRSRAMLAAAAVAAVLMLGGVAAVAAVRMRGGADAPSIAVLPFESRGAPEQAYFADGLTDAVTDKLIGVAGLTVIDPRSAEAYRGSPKSAAEIGRELGVAYLLRGVVSWVRDGDGQWRAQVRPSLVRTRDGAARWAGEPLVVTPTDPFTAQAEIAGRVVSEIGVAVASAERASLMSAPTTSPEAYALYLRARALRSAIGDNFSATDRAEAARLLEQATRLDPRFALAFAELARVRFTATATVLGDTGEERAVEAAVDTALALDPELPEAHAARAGHLWFDRSQFADALAAMARASARKPGDAEMLATLGVFQVATGQTTEGFATLERTTVLDPLNRAANGDAANFSWSFRRFDDAERHARRIVALRPGIWSGHAWLARTALARGDTVAARRILAQGERATGRRLSAPSIFWLLPPSLTVLTDDTLRGGGPPVPAVELRDSLRRYAFLGAWARETGQPARARAWFDTAAMLADRPRYRPRGRAVNLLDRVALHAIALGGAGRLADARRSIAYADSVERLNNLPNEPNMAAAQDALAYAQLLVGDRDGALVRLARVLELPSGRTRAVLRTMWPFTSLHDDPRFRRLVGL